MQKYLSLGAIAVFMGVVLLAASFPQNASAQSDESFRIQLESILSKFKNYRFANISVWQVSDIRDIRRAIREKEDELMTGAGSESTGDAECVQRIDPAVRTIIETQVQEGASQMVVQRSIILRNLQPPEQADFDCAYNYYASRLRGPVTQLRNAYVITTRKSADELVPNSIVALVVTTRNDAMQDNLNLPGPTNIYTLPEMVTFDLSSADYNARNLYELVVNAFQQGLVIDRTLEAQGIGTFRKFAPKKYGVAQSLVESEYEISATDIQKFIRISEIQPNDMYEKENELLISPDLISWKRFKPLIDFWEDGTADTLSLVTNQNLPKYGMELVYGTESVNYPSFWSERLALNAIWDNVKLGFILPTSGWASLSKDLFEVDRKMTHAGVGINGTLNFPVRVIPKSGLFHVDFGYVFGDAEPASYKNRKIDMNNPLAPVDNSDYLMRFNGQLHYTFGISIDDSYMVRFGLGGTVYVMETWFYDFDSYLTNQSDKIDYKMYEDKAVGGISTKIEFMTTKTSTPFGGSLQYFDESLYGHLWLQIPIVQNAFAVRLDAKMFSKALSNEPRVWENKSLFIPMARFIVNF